MDQALSGPIRSLLDLTLFILEGRRRWLALRPGTYGARRFVLRLTVVTAYVIDMDGHSFIAIAKRGPEISCITTSIP